MFTLDKRTRSALKNLKRCLDRVRPEDKADKHKNLGRTEEFASAIHDYMAAGTDGDAREEVSAEESEVESGGSDHVDSSEDEEGTYGPLPASMEVNRVFGPQVASTDPPAEQPPASRPLAPASRPLAPVTDKESPKEVLSGGREDWMLTPGNHKDVAELEGMFSVDGSLRTNKSGKFALGKRARQEAQELRAKKRQAPKSAEDLAAEAILAEYNTLRGPSLMEQHQQGRAKQGGTKKRELREAFDYQRDIVDGRVGADKNKIKTIMQEAQALSSRFDKGI